MTPTGVAVHCYWNGTVKKSFNDVVYEGNSVKVMPMKLDYGISYGGLLDKIYSITGIDKHKFELNIVCRYPLFPGDCRGIPISNDEAVQHMLELPSRSSAVYCVKLFLEKRALVGRRWEDLHMECLVNVFQKVGVKSLLLNVPFVCKSWYKASLHPNCWKILNFRNDFTDRDTSIWYREIFNRIVNVDHQVNITALVKFAVDRSHGCVTTLELPYSLAEEALEYAARKCPSLKSLILLSRPRSNPRTINPRLISKFKNLEMLTIHKANNVKDILHQISIHCNNFIKLSAPGLHFLADEAFIIASLPKIRYLVLRKANFVRRENVLMILNGCRDLIHLDVSNCIGFNEDDTEILRLASHIPEFNCECSNIHDYRAEYPRHNDYDYDSD